ncbi:DUF411 domain-containing protein [Betaproteobacteria bacterium PRO4]|uniref:DUF411 domain-containing protein n=1 Tax=Nitrosomonas sp. TaxID=42353 RepID=UPI00256852F1|nr:DUF411 domain-containing protein [Nitrosomonas sp.]MDL1866269.1 DUF411 domain-containing protein [Betaproteobacteria bacterium PRO4]
MKKQFNRFFTRSVLSAALAGFAGVAAAAAATVEVYKSPTCGCCAKWVDHMRDNGFTVNIHDIGNDEARAEAGILPELGSCHTAMVNGYAIEGHVPADDIKQLLKERPRAVGLSAPGMPHGSPGMETGREDTYNVLLIRKPGDKRNAAEIYNRYGPGLSQPAESTSENNAAQSILRLK